MWHMYKYFLKHPFRQDIFKQTYRYVVLREIISLLWRYIPYIREFKHMWYQMYEADNCLKHFNLVLF